MDALETRGGQKDRSSLATIRHLSRKDACVQRIREAIEAGELKAGEAVTELGLARKLGVAQPTIREVLLELEFSGFVERFGPRNTRITKLTPEQITEIYVLRSRLETLAIELLHSAPDVDLSRCEASYREMLEKGTKGDVKAFMRADLEFHRALWDATRNRTLCELLERLVPKLFAFNFIENFRSETKRMIEVAKLHGEIVSLIIQRRLEDAKRLMELSMRESAAYHFRVQIN